MKLKIYFAVCVITVVLSGCATGAKVDNMVLDQALSEKYDQLLQDQISIDTVTGGRKTNPAWLSEISNESFKDALISTLQSRGLYTQAGVYALSANLVKVEKPLLGLNVTVTTHIQYTLINTTTKQTILDELIVASSTVKVSDEILGVKRLRVANENSAKENIKMFLSALSLVDVDRLTLN